MLGVHKNTVVIAFWWGENPSLYLSADSQRGLITPEGREKHYRSTGSEARKHLGKGEALGSRRTGDLLDADTSHDSDNGLAALGLSFPTCIRKGSETALHSQLERIDL